jgi:K+-sensing histidine kinase KdpD
VTEELEGADHDRRVEVDSTGSTMWHWDPDLHAQVFSNQVANALRHGDPNNSVAVRIDGSRAANADVTVHNRGAIDPELLPRLFEPMTGGDRRGLNSRGLGLGLYISKQIIGSHGGSIDVVSDADTGTSFMVTLPRSSATNDGIAGARATRTF